MEQQGFQVAALHREFLRDVKNRKKRMKKKTTEIAIQFKVPPLELFQQIECENEVCDITNIKPNMLIFQIQPNEGIFLEMGIKPPGMRLLVEKR